MKEEGLKGNGRSGGDDDAKKRSVARSSASFSSGKEVEEPWPLPLLWRTNEKDAAWSFVSFLSEKETKEPWPPPLLEISIQISLYKQLNIKMTIINSQPLFIRFLNSAAQR